MVNTAEIKWILARKRDKYSVRKNFHKNNYIKFSGTLLAEKSSKYEGGLGSWDEYALYKTDKGEYVCSKAEITQWMGESDQYKAVICKDIKSVANFFDGDPTYTNGLAQALFDEAAVLEPEFAKYVRDTDYDESITIARMLEERPLHEWYDHYMSNYSSISDFATKYDMYDERAQAFLAAAEEAKRVTA